MKNVEATQTTQEESSSEWNSFAAPSVSLPKGGGAIKGMGENFDFSKGRFYLRRRDFIGHVPWELASGSGISIRAEEAWKITRGSPDVTIAIIDEAFDIRRLPPGSKVEVLKASECGIPTAELLSAHGARLAELIAGNREGYPGVAPGCRFLLVELSSFCTDAEEAYAFDLAYQFNAAAVCCAWGPAYQGPNVSRPMPACVSASIERLAKEGRGGLGTLVFFAAGNQGGDVALDRYASHAMVTTVGGITKRGGVPRNTDFGDKIEITASVSSAEGVIGGMPGHPTGNSGAAALVTGVAGLVFSVNPGLRASQVIDILKRTSNASEVGVVDASKAVVEAKTATPVKASGKRQAPRHDVTVISEKRQFRERRFDGGEHSYIGMTAASMLQSVYELNGGTPQGAFFGAPFTNFASPGGSASYSSQTTNCIKNFFNPANTTTQSVTGITKYPGFPVVAVSGSENDLSFVPFGYLVGLAGDVYGTPDDLGKALDIVLADTESVSNDTFASIVEIFNLETKNNFNLDDDADIFLANAFDPLTHYIGLAKKNFSHFAGHNFLFYLSYHLLAVNDAFSCATAGSPTAAQKLFNSALVKEAFALHYLSDMFSSGHARVPRWAFLHGNLSYGPAAKPVSLDQSGADVISKLLHDNEGTLGCVVMNASGKTTTKNYMWKILGDGSLGTDFASPPSQDTFIYGYDKSGSALTKVAYTDEAINIAAYIPPGVQATGNTNLRRFDLLTSVAFASLADVFRHMAQDSSTQQAYPIATSAQATSGTTGLLGYVLERIPFALPIKPALATLGLDQLQASMMSTFFASSSATDYTQTELSYRLGDEGYAQLWKTYKDMPSAVKGFCKAKWFYCTFTGDFCTGKFDAASATSSTPFEQSWVTGQIGNLQPVFVTSAAVQAAIPSILSGSTFASTLTDPYTPPPVPLPGVWADAIPQNLISALCPGVTATNTGIWGIDEQ